MNLRFCDWEHCPGYDSYLVPVTCSDTGPKPCWHDQCAESSRKTARVSLRDELAAVLGPGNDDEIAYEQADTVLQVIWEQGYILVRSDYASPKRGPG